MVKKRMPPCMLMAWSVLSPHRCWAILFFAQITLHVNLLTACAHAFGAISVRQGC